MVIKSPQKYAGRTLEGHLRLYDWKNEFYTFERTIKTSSFDGMCNSAYVPSRVSYYFSALRLWLIMMINKIFFHQITGSPSNITKPYRPPDQICPPRDSQVNPTYKLIRSDNDDIGENLIEDGEKGKAIRSNPSTFSLELSSSSQQNRLSFAACLLLGFVLHFSKVVLT